MPGKRVWVIGDIHGMFDPLNRLLRRIRLVQQERPVESTRIVCIGDYIDYGPSSRQVLDELIRLSAEFDCTFLAGNHEDLLLQFLRKDELYRRFGNTWFRLNDGVETVASLLDDPSRLHELYAEGAAAGITPDTLRLPERYLTFLDHLAYAHREDFADTRRSLHFAFCHGLLQGNGEANGNTAIDTAAEVEEQLDLRTYDQFHTYRRERRKWIEDLHLWNRDASPGRYGHYILIHGHTPTVLLKRFLPDLGGYNCACGLPFLGFVRQPVTLHGTKGFRINVDATLDELATVDIDTGAVYGKCLTALLLDEQDMLSDFTISAYQVRMDRPHRHGQDLVHVEFGFLP
jgi:hypothetical protein